MYLSVNNNRTVDGSNSLNIHRDAILHEDILDENSAE